MQTLATTSKPATVLGFFMAISLTVLISLTPSQKALMISMSWMFGIAFLALLDGLQGVSSGGTLICDMEVHDEQGT
jgi:hypothetical protein